MADGYILERSEIALNTYLSNSFANSSFGYYTGMDTSDKITPCITSQAISADEDFYGSGVYHVSLRVYFIYPFEDSSSLQTRNTTYNTFCQTLYDNTNLISQMTASNLSVYDIFGKGHANSVQQNHWVSEHELELIAAYTA